MKRRSFLLAAGALAACRADLGRTADARAGVVVIGWKLDEISSLDPAEAFERASTEISRNIYNTLLVYDAADPSVLKGHAAESWTSSPDARRYVFKLRRGMKFHSGRPVTANDFVYSLTRAVTLNRAPTFILDDIGINKNTVAQCVRAQDPGTIVIELPEPRAQRLVLCSLTTNVAAIVDSEECKAHVSGNDFGNEWLKTHSAGSGPFKLRAWRPNQLVALDRFAGYWRGPAKASSIFLRHLPEPSTQQLLLEKGDIDIARNLNPSQVATLGSRAGMQIQTAKTFRLIYLGLNATYAPFQKPEVVEAVKNLINYEGICKTVLNGFASPRQSFVPLGIPSAVTETPYALRIDRARELLSAAGYSKGFEVALDVRGSSPDLDIAQTLQASFGKAGIKLSLLSGDYKQMLTKYKSRHHQMALANWGADYPDPHSMAGTFASNPDNSDDSPLKTVAWRASWDIPQITRDVAAAAREADADKRTAMYEKIQRAYMKTSPIVEMFQERQVIVRRKNVDGLLLAPSSYPDNYYGVKKT
jgi:peptide/nickel transport system substrate-binding protein